MSERKLTRGLEDIAPNNSDKEARLRTAKPPEKTKERKKLEPIVNGSTVKQKSSFFSKIKDSFLGEGGNVGEFIVYDILVPAFRNTISDMGFGLVEMFFGGGGRDYGRDRGRNPRVVRDRGRSYIDYHTPSGSRGRSSRDRDRDRDDDRSDRARHEFGNIVYNSRREAELVLSRLGDIIEEYDEVTVAAFYELSKIESTAPDNDYGWTNLRDAYTDRARNGFIIVLPQPRPL